MTNVAGEVRNQASPEPAALMVLEDSRLAELARLARAAGLDRIAADAEAFAERLVEGRFYVACVGQFKRGKSSLLNALVGEAVLPVGVVPVTAAVTVLRHGRERRARVRFLDGRWQEIDTRSLAAYVSEEHNPENERGVAAVEVFVPSPLLASGMCLVDTPGLGSCFAGNTEVTRAFVPHIDAALVVLGADPPISADELAITQEVARHSSELLFVLNKADRLSEAERREARVFTERVVGERLGRTVTLLEVSATERLSAGGPPRDWAALCGHLQALADRSGSSLLRAAEERGARLLSARLMHGLDEQRDALLRPMEESERRLHALRACVAEAGRSLNDLGYLFSAEEARLAREFSRRKDEFVAAALPVATARFRQALDELGPCRGPSLRARAITAAQEISAQLIDAWLPDVQRAAESLYVEAMRRFVKLGNEFLERLASSGEPGLTSLPRHLGPETGFRTRSRLYYTELWGLTTRNPLGWLLDAMRTRKGARRAVERDVGQYVERLLTTNATRVENDFNDRVLESRRRLHAEIESLLRDVYASAERALERARERRAEGAGAVREELDRIASLRQQVEKLDPRQDSDIVQ